MKRPTTPNTATPKTVPRPIAAKKPRIGRHSTRRKLRRRHRPARRLALGAHAAAPNRECTMGRASAGGRTSRAIPAAIDGDREVEELAAIPVRRRRAASARPVARRGRRSPGLHRRSVAAGDVGEERLAIDRAGPLIDSVSSVQTIGGSVGRMRAWCRSRVDCGGRRCGRRRCNRTVVARAVGPMQFERCSCTLQIGAQCHQLDDLSLATSSLSATTVRSRSCTGPQRPPSQAMVRSAISSRLQPSCFARAMNASAPSV